MGIFGRKAKGDIAVIKDIDIIASNVKELYTIAVKLNDSRVYADKVSALAGSYQYITPKQNSETIDKDKKIADCVGDLHVATARALKTKQYDEIDDILQKIKVLISER